MSSLDFEAPQLAEKYDQLSDGQYESGKALVDLLGLKTGSTVLDLGCGTGRLALYAASIVGQSGKVHAIDPSPPRIEVAERKLKDSGLTNVTYRVAGSDDLSGLENDSFNAAYLSAVLHWVPDKEATINQLYRVLSPGGRVGITTNEREHPFTFRQIVNKVLAREPYAGHVDLSRDAEKPLTLKELEYLLKAAGFRDVEVKLTTRTRYYSSPAHVIETSESSAFGTFLRQLPEAFRDNVKKDIEEELEKRRTPEGIPLEIHTILATAVKPIENLVPVYYAQSGKENTRRTLELSLQAARRFGIKNIVVASTSGESGVLAAELLAGTGISLVVVSLNTREDAQPFSQSARKRIEELGGKVLTGTLLLSGLGNVIKDKGGYSHERIIGDTLRLFGQGTKVIVEISAMAADAGLVPFGDIIAVAGTGKGADTAAIIRASSSNKFFDLRVREFIVKPAKF